MTEKQGKKCIESKLLSSGAFLKRSSTTTVAPAKAKWELNSSLLLRWQGPKRSMRHGFVLGYTLTGRWSLGDASASGSLIRYDVCSSGTCLLDKNTVLTSSVLMVFYQHDRQPFLVALSSFPLSNNL